MLKRLIIVIMFFAIGVFQAAFADGNIVAILVSLRQEGVCTDSCHIYEYSSDGIGSDMLGYYSIMGSHIYKYSSDKIGSNLLAFYSIMNSHIYEYSSDEIGSNLLGYYSIMGSHIYKYSSDISGSKLLKFYSTY